MRIALALGGGAALGWAHIGVLRVLADAGIEVGAVAGTSMGAVVACALAAGRLDRLEAIARGVTRMNLGGWLDPAMARGGLLGARRIERELEGEFGELRLELLPIPTACVAVDLRTAQEVRLTSGLVRRAVRASVSLPAVFAPVEIDGRLLIDGGMASNLPLGAARVLAPDLPLVGVDVMADYDGHCDGTMPHGRDRLPDWRATGRAAFLSMIVAQTRREIERERPDFVISPQVGEIGTTAFASAALLIERGREAAEAALPALRALAGVSAPATL